MAVVSHQSFIFISTTLIISLMSSVYHVGIRDRDIVPIFGCEN